MNIYKTVYYTFHSRCFCKIKKYNTKLYAHEITIYYTFYINIINTLHCITDFY